MSDAKNEGSDPSTQQHEKKSLEEQETKLSNDRNTVELEMTQESLGEQEAFLANLGQLDICEIQTIAEIIEILHENEDQARDHFSKTNSSSLLQPTCRASPLWLERRSELEENIVELDAARTTNQKHWPCSLKRSRCAEDEEYNAYAVLRNRVKPAKHSKRKVLTSIGEDMRAVSRDTELLRFRLETTHTQNLRNPGHCWMKHRPLVVVLWRDDTAPMSVN